MRRVTWCALAAMTLFVVGCKTKQPETESKPAESAKVESPAPAPAPPPTPSETKPATSEPMAAPAPAAKAGNLLKPATLNEKAPEKYEVKFKTTRGDFTLEVTRAWAPLSADRFYNLVRGHFFDDTAFFRVVPGFVVQFGISGKPAVSAAWKNVNIMDDPNTQTNKRGTITFAQTSEPNSRGTQVFINLKDNGRLDHYGQGFAPFGVVEGDGMNVVEMMYEGYGDNAGPDQAQIEKQGTPYLKKGWPKLDYIVSASIVGAPAAPAAASKKVQ
ncbi:MAG TPA: peptidylprolyl isomerase [Candidatus Acidoferrum sp.]|nr:peptidylprolyl isomerase [Candidatus Acidoferrum sp.]